MSRAKEEATIIILDIGRNTSSGENNEKSFFQTARDCTTRIIERKIMSKGKHLVGIILLGSKKTKNNMADECEGAFRHIELNEDLQTPTWKMIRNLPTEPSKCKGDWLDALIVAADYYKNGVSGFKLASKKIVLMTNFEIPSKLNVDVKLVLSGFKEESYEVDVIGPDIYDEFNKSEDIELAKSFVEETDGATATFENTMDYLLFHKNKAVNAMPWNVDLSIGPNIKIPVSTFIRLRDEPTVKNWMKAIKDPVTNKASSKEAVVRVPINAENQATVDEKKQMIKGYEYGQQIIPLSDCDKLMLYESGDKCLMVYGFTHKNNIKWHNLNGDGLSYVFGRKGDTKAQNAVRCLVECLHEMNLVGIVRRVYNRGNAPKMFALMPVIDTNNYVCLSLIGICFNEDIKNMSFPQVNLKKYKCTKEQVNAFEDLIKAMDLTKAYDDNYDDAEAFPIAKTVSPIAQYVLDCIAYRAMNPGKPLPKPRDEIMQPFKPPPLIQEKATKPLEAIKKLFPLNMVEVKTKGRNKNNAQTENYPIKQDPGTSYVSHEMPKVELPVLKTKKIGTADPIKDFKALADEGAKLADLSLELTEAIESLLYCNLDGKYAKGIETMSFFREVCVKDDPSHYNDWIKKFKTSLIQHNNNDIIELIKNNNLDSIVQSENSLSSLEPSVNHDESQIYECDTIPNSTEFSIRTEVNDMFDDM